MLFNTLPFLIFLPSVLALYFLLPRRAQNVMLLAASYYFYGQWDWRFLALIVVSTVVDYICALAIADGKRGAVWISVATNLAILGFFKYCNFFLENLHRALASIGLDVPSHGLDIVVPVGISFYTFQTMSYTIDVYRRRMAPTRNFLNFALFVAFFPQLVAGPIERASHLLPQVESKRTVSLAEISSGFHQIAWGLFKKVFVADNLAVYVVDPIFDPAVVISGVTVLIGVYAFAFQIYCDFSGYSDIAIGSARCMGFSLRKNFDLPYFATSPKEFWAGWHISLSTWLRDYLYIPLGGNRAGRTTANLLCTMLLGGLWHGAAWKFIAWGAYHGLLLVGFRNMDAKPRLPWVVRVVGFFHLTCFGWLIFRAQDLAQIRDMITGLVGDFFLISDPDFIYTKHLVFFAGPLLLIQIAQRYWRVPKSQTSREGTLNTRLPWPVRGVVYAVFFYLFITLGEFGGKEFIYFQF